MAIAKTVKQCETEVAVAQTWVQKQKDDSVS